MISLQDTQGVQCQSCCLIPSHVVSLLKAVLSNTNCKIIIKFYSQTDGFIRKTFLYARKEKENWSYTSCSSVNLLIMNYIRSPLSAPFFQLTSILLSIQFFYKGLNNNKSCLDTVISWPTGKRIIIGPVFVDYFCNLNTPRQSYTFTVLESWFLILAFISVGYVCQSSCESSLDGHSVWQYFWLFCKI